MNKQIKQHYPQALAAILSFCLSSALLAQEPVVIEGAVPNEAAKQEILSKLYAAYGQANVVDKIQVRAVRAPNGWSSAVSNVITEDLKKVRQGRLSVRA